MQIGGGARRERSFACEGRLRRAREVAPVLFMKRNLPLAFAGVLALSIAATAQAPKADAPPPPAVPDVTPAATLPNAKPAEPPRIVPTEHFAVPEGMEITVWATTPMLF